MEPLGPSNSTGYDSREYVERNDAGMSGECYLAPESAGDAEQDQSYADSAAQDIERQWLEYQAWQASLYTDQFGNSQSSPSGYPQYEAGLPNAIGGQDTHQTQGFESDQAFESYQVPDSYASASSNYSHPQYAASAALDDQVLDSTQPLYNFSEATQPYPYYDPSIQDNNTMPARRDQVAEPSVGPRPAENRQRHLEERVDQWVGVLSTPVNQAMTRSNGWTHNPGSTSLDNTRGEPSVETSHPSGPLPGSLSALARHASNPVSYTQQGQAQTSFIPHTSPVARQQSAQEPANANPPAVHDTSRRVSNHDGTYLQIPTSETSSFRPSSSGSSAPPDPLYCDICSAIFQGKWRQGNCGRHRRQKHGVNTMEYNCMAPGCDAVFQRGDARLKHFRQKHPELLQGGS